MGLRIIKYRGGQTGRQADRRKSTHTWCGGVSITISEFMCSMCNYAYHGIALHCIAGQGKGKQDSIV